MGDVNHEKANPDREALPRQLPEGNLHHFKPCLSISVDVRPQCGRSGSVQHSNRSFTQLPSPPSPSSAQPLNYPSAQLFIRTIV